MKKNPKEVQKTILTKYAKFVVHMRRQIDDKRFGLVMGAGASRDLGFPDWKSLIQRIAEHKKINATDLTSHASMQSSVTQLLYHRFRENIKAEAEKHAESYKKRDTYEQAEWRKIVHECLYTGQDHRRVASTQKKLINRTGFSKIGGTSKGMVNELL